MLIFENILQNFKQHSV